MKTTILSILLFCCIALMAKSQTPLNQGTGKKFNHAIGAAGGFCTGYGIAYLCSHNRLKAQVTFSPYYDKWDESRYTSLYTGFTFYYMLEQNKVISFFAYQSNMWNYYRHKDILSTGWRTKTVNSTRNALGLGLEFKFLQKVSFHLMAGYGWYGDDNMITLTGESGIFYNFR